MSLKKNLTDYTWEHFLPHNTHLSVSIRNADINSNHDENSDGDTKVTDQATNLGKASGAQRSKLQIRQNLDLLVLLREQFVVLRVRGGNVRS